jgi:hypothetical protein
LVEGQRREGDTRRRRGLGAGRRPERRGGVLRSRAETWTGDTGNRDVEDMEHTRDKRQ